MIVFALLNARLMIRMSVSWAMTIICWNLTEKNAPALNPKFIGNIGRLSVEFATLSVHPERDMDATT